LILAALASLASLDFVEALDCSDDRASGLVSTAVFFVAVLALPMA